ncbi:hypothetical protein Tco_1422080 [Tanacetum coccineum]
MTNDGCDDGTQHTTYEQVKDDEHVILTTLHDTQKTEVTLQSSSVSSDFDSQFLNLDNVLPTDTEVVSLINVKVCHEEPSTQTLPLLNIPVMSFCLEKELSQFQQADYSAQLLKTVKLQIPVIVDAQLSIRLEDSIQKAFKSYTTKFEKKSKDERKRYIDLVENTITESLENVVLAKSSFQPKSTYEATSSLTEFELKKILLDKMRKKESVFKTADTEMPQNQGGDLGNTDDQPNVEAASNSDWFKKPKRPPTPDPDWNDKISIDFRPP